MRSSRGGDRVGIYFAETGASQRPSIVVYDRARFGDQRDGPGDRRLGRRASRRRWFHVTGITPALGATAARTRRGWHAAAQRAGAASASI